MEYGSFAGFALDVDATMVACHDAVDDGQPQPGAGALFLGGKKRVENSFEHLAAHAVAGVADGQPHIRPCLQVPGSGLRLPVNFHLIQDDLQQPPLAPIACAALVQRFMRI